MKEEDLAKLFDNVRESFANITAYYKMVFKDVGDFILSAIDFKKKYSKKRLNMKNKKRSKSRWRK